MKMTPFNAYRAYMSTKLHFSSDTYDMIAQGANVNAKEETFNKKGLRFAVARLSKKYKFSELVQYVLSNILAGDKNGGLFDAEGEDRYLAWKKRMQSLTYVYQQDLIRLKEADVGVGLSPIWTTINGRHPLLLREYLAKNVSLETLVIINMLYKYTETLDEQLSYDPVWKATSKLIRKYTPFVNIAGSDFAAITEQVFN